MPALLARASCSPALQAAQCSVLCCRLIDGQRYHRRSHRLAIATRTTRPGGTPPWPTRGASKRADCTGLIPRRPTRPRLLVHHPAGSRDSAGRRKHRAALPGLCRPGHRPPPCPRTVMAVANPHLRTPSPAAAATTSASDYLAGHGADRTRSSFATPVATSGNAGPARRGRRRRSRW